MKGAYYLVGIVLLTATFIGAKMLIDQSASAQAKQQNEIELNKPQNLIVSWGHFDVEQGVAGLYPKQFGDVLEVTAENTRVKAGAVLLRIDDKMAKLKVVQAKNAVIAAEQQVAKARQLTKFYELQIAQQAAAIKSIEYEVLTLERKRDTELSSATKTDPVYKTIQERYKFGFDQIAQKKVAEEAKLEQLKLQDAKLEIAAAEADLNAKKAQFEEAEELVKHFQVVAPSDGTVLRVYVRKGETLGPNPRIHAIEFLPDAPVIVRGEVLQEWGHYVKEGQEVVIEDDTYKGPMWKGKVKSISRWYAPTRSPIIEPFRYNDVRTLECIITVDSGPDAKFIGQRVRAKIKM